MINCSFLPLFYAHHQHIKMGRSAPAINNFHRKEEIWLALYGLGKMETYQYLYTQCNSIEDLEKWMVSVKGESQVRESAAAFEQWTKGESGTDADAGTGGEILSEAQWQHWKDFGYIKISDLVDGHLCDAVVNLICQKLNVDLSIPESWYNSHPDWHGLMLQVYQDERIHAIKTLPSIRQVFTELYGTTNLIPNTEKLSFSPPESATWKFNHNKLHWDIDFTNIDLHYIQGLVYLNDVPDDRGPLTVVPGFHHRFEAWMQQYPDPHQAHEIMRAGLTGTPVTGKKGDVVLWLQTLPHAASANHSELPRFVQYLSFARY